MFCGAFRGYFGDSLVKVAGGTGTGTVVGYRGLDVMEPGVGPANMGAEGVVVGTIMGAR